MSFFAFGIQIWQNILYKYVALKYTLKEVLIHWWKSCKLSHKYPRQDQILAVFKRQITADSLKESHPECVSVILTMEMFQDVCLSVANVCIWNFFIFPNHILWKEDLSCYLIPVNTVTHNVRYDL